MNLEIIQPDWPVPPGVRALSTTRRGGVSTGPWAGLNLGTNCGDDSRAVAENRKRLAQLLPSAPRFPNQVHGRRVISFGSLEDGEADAVIVSAPEQVCAVLTADCLPVLFCNLEGSRVAAAHAGWRGLAAGVLEQTVRALEAAPETIVAWLGPAIGQDHYEVGAEVRDAFLRADPANDAAFQAAGEGWNADLYALARLALERAGVRQVYGGGWCTACEPERFYSYRRDGVTGRMATLVWIRAG